MITSKKRMFSGILMYIICCSLDKTNQKSTYACLERFIFITSCLKQIFVSSFQILLCLKKSRKNNYVAVALVRIILCGKLFVMHPLGITYVCEPLILQYYNSSMPPFLLDMELRLARLSSRDVDLTLPHMEHAYPFFNQIDLYLFDGIPPIIRGISNIVSPNQRKICSYDLSVEIFI